MTTIRLNYNTFYYMAYVSSGTYMRAILKKSNITVSLCLLK